MGLARLDDKEKKFVRKVNLRRTDIEVVLASSSPRRKVLLNSLFLEFKCISPIVDEANVSEKDPISLVRKLSYLKAITVSENLSNNNVIIGCDTVVSISGKILGKPKDKVEARQMLRMLSGNKHEVTTGVCVIYQNKIHQFEKTTKVTFYKLTDKEIEAYISTEEPYDKAGGYGIQNMGALFVKKIDGDYFNVVGLPIAKLNRLLIKLGVK